jgi:hypothetical protein
MRKSEPARKAQETTESWNPFPEMFSPVLTLLALAFLMVLVTWESPMKAEESADQLAVCQSKLNTWEDWARGVSPKAAPKGFQTFEDFDQFLVRNGKISLDEELLAENQRLRDRNRRLEDLRDVIWPGAMVLVGSAIGFYLLFLAIRSLRRIPISQARKQLFVLIGAAIWVTLGILGSANRIEYHPVSAVAGAFLWSLPGLLCAGIFLWWYSQRVQKGANVALRAAAVPASLSPIVPQGEMTAPETVTNLPQSASTINASQREEACISEHQSAADQVSGELQQTLLYPAMGERLKAYTCDFAVIFLVLGTFILSGVSTPNSAGAGTALFVAYMTLSQSIFHTTVGKYVFGLELRSTSPRRLYPSFWAVLSRETAGRFVSTLFCGVGYWAWVRRPQNQAWSDQIAGTVVVKRNTTVRLRRFLKALVVVSLLFTICFYLVYIYSLTSHF